MCGTEDRDCVCYVVWLCVLQEAVYLCVSRLVMPCWVARCRRGPLGCEADIPSTFHP